MSCLKCNNGLIPFMKNGKVIPYAWVDCECKISIPESFDPVRLEPSDFDFPMSDTFRTASYQYCNQPDPGAVTASVEREVEVRYRPRPVDKEIDQLKGGFIHIQKVINEHVDASKKKRGKY